MSSKSDSQPRFLWTPVVVYMGAIFFASSLSNPPVPTNSDKSLHWLAYLGLAVLVVRALAGGLPRRIGIGVALTAVVIAVAYGATDEVHQMFVPGRTADIFDLVADSFGAIAGTIICWVWGYKAQSTRLKAQGASRGVLGP